jgi:hypothetical protein
METPQETAIDFQKTQAEYVDSAYEKKSMSSRFSGLQHILTTKDGWLGDYDYGYLCMPRIPFLSKKSNTPPFFGLNLSLPILLAVFLGFQHCLAMVSGVVTVRILLDVLTVN